MNHQQLPIPLVSLFECLLPASESSSVLPTPAPPALSHPSIYQADGMSIPDCPSPSMCPDDHPLESSPVLPTPSPSARLHLSICRANRMSIPDCPSPSMCLDDDP